MQQSKTILLIFLLATSLYTFAQNNIKTSFKYSNHTIIIYYEFQGDSAKGYDVSVELKRTSVPDFSLKPELLTGDFGKGKYANAKRKIVWHLTQQEEESFTADDYYFEVTADEIKGGEIAWYYYVGGAIVGGTAAILLLHKNNETPATTSSDKYPPPPGRPN